MVAADDGLAIQGLNGPDAASKSTWSTQVSKAPAVIGRDRLADVGGSALRQRVGQVAQRLIGVVEQPAFLQPGQMQPIVQPMDRRGAGLIAGPLADPGEAPCRQARDIADIGFWLVRNLAGAGVRRGPMRRQLQAELQDVGVPDVERAARHLFAEQRLGRTQRELAPCPAAATPLSRSARVSLWLWSISRKAIVGRRDLLSAEARRNLSGVATDRDSLARLYTLGSADLGLIEARREERNRLGFAVQRALIRNPGLTLVGAQAEDPVGQAR